MEADRYMRKGLYLGWAPTLMVGQLLQVRQLLASLINPCDVHMHRGAQLKEDRVLQ